MKRTPWWVFAAAAGLQLAALGLCLWAMDHIRRIDEMAVEPSPSPPKPEAPPPKPEAPPPQPPPTRPPATPAQEPELLSKPPPEVIEPGVRAGNVTIRALTAEQIGEHRFPESPPHPPQPRPAPGQTGPLLGAPPPRPEPAPVRVQPPSPGAPLFGPSPAAGPQGQADSNGLPSFISELADPTTQMVCGIASGRQFAFGFYPDGNIRFVDVDGGRYAGKADSARARMREVDGMRAFTVQIGVAADGRLQASFTGGQHDARTIALEPMTGSTG